MPTFKGKGSRIEISDPVLEAKGALQEIQKSFSFHNNVVIAVFLLGFLVLIFTVIGLVLQSWQFNTTYQNESAQLKIQEDLIKNTAELQKEQNELLKTILKSLSR